MEAVFVNSGVLGQRTFAKFVDRYVIDQSDDIEARQIIVTDSLSFRQRALRRLVCTRLVPGNRAGLSNVDFFRFRAELAAGILAEEKIGQVEKVAGRIDVLHFHRQGTAYRSLQRMRTTPAIVSIDCTQSMFAARAQNSFDKLSYTPGARRDGKVFDAAKLIIAASEWAAACLRREYPDCKTEIAVRPNPVDVNVFSDNPADERRAKQENRKVEVLFLGGDFERKGGPDLLKAWQEGRFVDVATLTIVTAKNIPRQQHDGVVWLTDISALTDQWMNLWQTADVFVMPTREEPFGNVFQEAGAAGLPSIGTRINAIPERIVDGETGLLVPSRNIAELVRALKTLIEDAELRYRMGIAARRYIEKTADPNDYAAFLATRIRRLASLRRD